MHPYSWQYSFDSFVPSSYLISHGSELHAQTLFFHCKLLSSLDWAHLQIFQVLELHYLSASKQRAGLAT